MASGISRLYKYNDEIILKTTDKILKTYRDEVLPCYSFSEFCDVNGE